MSKTTPIKKQTIHPRRKKNFLIRYSETRTNQQTLTTCIFHLPTNIESTPPLNRLTSLQNIPKILSDYLV